MYSNYNYYPQQPTAPTVPNYTNYYRNVQPQVILKGRQVSSLEEARATSIDFDGSVFYFPDLANKRIYTKQINMDGTATLNMYELMAMPIERETQQSILSADNFITRDEFEKVIASLRSAEKLGEPPVQRETAVSEPKKEVINYF